MLENVIDAHDENREFDTLSWAGLEALSFSTSFHPPYAHSYHMRAISMLLAGYLSSIN